MTAPAAAAAPADAPADAPDDDTPAARLAARVEAAVTDWPGVTAAPHRFGGREFRVGRREIGHLHAPAGPPGAGGWADLPFPRRVRDALLADGRAGRHHWLPASGWVSVPLRRPADVPALVALLRLNYDRPWLSTREPGAAADAPSSRGEGSVHRLSSAGSATPNARRKNVERA